MHWGCFVWTATPGLSGWRTPRPGPLRVSVCSLFLAGSGGPESRAHFGAPHIFCGRSVFLLCLAPFRLGLPLSCSFVCPNPFFLLRPRGILPSLVSGPGCPPPWRSVPPPPGPGFYFIQFFPFGQLGLMFPSSHLAFPLSPPSLIFLWPFSASPLSLFVLWASRSSALCVFLFSLCSAMLLGRYVLCRVSGLVVVLGLLSCCCGALFTLWCAVLFWSALPCVLTTT